MPVPVLPRLLVLLALLAAPLQAPAQGRPAAVDLEEVQIRDIAETVPVFAEVVTARDGAVASRVAGNVALVHVLPGDRVAEGDLLVELDRVLLDIRLAQAVARLAEADAGVRSASAQATRAEGVFARIAGLRETSSFSEGRFDDAQSDLLAARANLAEAEARRQTADALLAEARYLLDRTRIAAPFAGTVIAVTTIPGAYIQAGTSVVRMIDADAFEIEASVPGRYTGALRPGMAILAETDTGVTMGLEVRAVLPLEDQATRTRAVRFTAPGLGSLQNIAAGQSLTVSIPISAPRTALSVPKDALVQGRGGWTVYVEQDGAAQPRTIQIGAALGDRFEVLSGLNAGDMVVVRGNERLRPGQPIAAGGGAPAPAATN